MRRFWSWAEDTFHVATFGSCGRYVWAYHVCHYLGSKARGYR